MSGAAVAALGLVTGVSAYTSTAGFYASSHGQRDDGAIDLGRVRDLGHDDGGCGSRLPRRAEPVGARLRVHAALRSRDSDHRHRCGDDIPAARAGCCIDRAPSKRWAPIKNLALNAVSLLALVVVTRYGILLAWVIPTVLAVVPITHFLPRTLVPHHRGLTREGREEIGTWPVVRYVAGNYVGFLGTMAYRNLPPILVLHELGAKQSGFRPGSSRRRSRS